MEHVCEAHVQLLPLVEADPCFRGHLLMMGYIKLWYWASKLEEADSLHGMHSKLYSFYIILFWNHT